MATAQTFSSVGSLSVDAPRIILGDAFEWLKNAGPSSIHAVVTDPPYGLVEYTPRQLEKLREGHGGVWRIPPAFDNAVRKPLPRFTVLNDDDKQRLEAFFERFAALLMPVLVPGAHIFIATNPLVSHFVYMPFIRAGFEKRGEIVRVVQTLARWRPPQECPRGVSIRFRNAPVVLGTLGTVSQALRRTCPGQPPQLENRRTDALVRR